MFYPAQAKVFGRLRRRQPAGRAGPSAAITDLTSLRFWARPGGGGIHPKSVNEVRAIAGRRAEVVAVRGFNDPPSRSRSIARTPPAALDLSADRRLGGRALRRGLGRRRSRGRGCHGARARRRRCAGPLCATTMRCASGSRSDSAWPVRGSGSGACTNRMPEVLAAADALGHLHRRADRCSRRSVRGRRGVYGWGHGHVRVNNRAYARLSTKHGP